MSCGSSCRHCTGADPSRVKEDMIRCTRKHKFVNPTDICPEYGFDYKPVDMAELRRSLTEYNIKKLSGTNWK